ncbi:MAG: hypothetical protein HOQ05_04790 [Corynebacteriales bacterium]|nr:hypothetical protein [Mycobacteriales bacterium]
MAKKKAVVQTPEGDEKTFQEAYDELDLFDSFAGMFEEGPGTSWDTNLPEITARGMELGTKSNIPDMETRLLKLPGIPSIPEDSHTLVHLSGTEQSLHGQLTGSSLKSYCVNRKDRCGFGGFLIETGPVISQSSWVYGPVDVSLTHKVSVTNTRSETSGWSIGASIKAENLVGNNVEASGSFTYSNSHTDTTSKAAEHSEEFHYQVPAGQHWYEQVRLAGGQYLGFFVVYYPARYQKIDQVYHSGNPDKIFDKYGIPWEIKYEKLRRTYWQNTKPIIEIFPAKVAIKAPGGVPVVTRNPVKTTPSKEIDAKAVALHEQISRVENSPRGTPEAVLAAKMEIAELSSRVSELLAGRRS